MRFYPTLGNIRHTLRSLAYGFVNTYDDLLGTTHPTSQCAWKRFFIHLSTRGTIGVQYSSDMFWLNRFRADGPSQPRKYCAQHRLPMVLVNQGLTVPNIVCVDYDSVRS